MFSIIRQLVVSRKHVDGGREVLGRTNHQLLGQPPDRRKRCNLCLSACSKLTALTKSYPTCSEPPNCSRKREEQLRVSEQARYYEFVQPNEWALSYTPSGCDISVSKVSLPQDSRACQSQQRERRVCQSDQAALESARNVHFLLWRQRGANTRRGKCCHNTNIDAVQATRAVFVEGFGEIQFCTVYFGTWIYINLII